MSTLDIVLIITNTIAVIIAIFGTVIPVWILSLKRRTLRREFRTALSSGPLDRLGMTEN